MVKRTRKVRIETRTVGQSFATCGVLRDARTGRKLAETDERPYGFVSAASRDAADYALLRGWVVVGDAAIDAEVSR